MVHLTKDGSAMIKTPTGKPGYSRVVASAAIDSWAFDAVLFHMSTGKTLFHTNQDDNIDQDALPTLAGWSDKTARVVLAEVQHRLARHLLSLLLVRDPTRRPSMRQLLEHPFVTGEPVLGRLVVNVPITTSSCRIVLPRIVNTSSSFTSS